MSSIHRVSSLLNIVISAWQDSSERHDPDAARPRVVLRHNLDIEWVVEREMEPVIPPHQRAKGDKAQRPYDKWWYRERHLVECFINKIKHFRRVFSRFDKLAGRYLGFLQFVSTLIWLR